MTKKLVSLTALLLACSSGALAACGGPLEYAPKPTARAPEADAKIVAEVQKSQGNTKLTLKVIHLAPPARLQDGATTFVVWQRKDSDKPWTRIGGLAYKEGDREGKLEEASVPETTFELIVTAEEKADVASPSPAILFEQKVN